MGRVESEIKCPRDDQADGKCFEAINSDRTNPTEPRSQVKDEFDLDRFLPAGWDETFKRLESGKAISVLVSEPNCRSVNDIVYTVDCLFQGASHDANLSFFDPISLKVDDSSAKFQTVGRELSGTDHFYRPQDFLGFVKIDYQTLQENLATVDLNNDTVFEIAQQSAMSLLDEIITHGNYDPDDIYYASKLSRLSAELNQLSFDPNLLSSTPFEPHREDVDFLQFNRFWSYVDRIIHDPSLNLATLDRENLVRQLDTALMLDLKIERGLFDDITTELLMDLFQKADSVLSLGNPCLEQLSPADLERLNRLRQGISVLSELLLQDYNASDAYERHTHCRFNPHLYYATPPITLIDIYSVNALLAHSSQSDKIDYQEVQENAEGLYETLAGFHYLLTSTELNDEELDSSINRLFYDENALSLFLRAYDALGQQAMDVYDEYPGPVFSFSKDELSIRLELLKSKLSTRLERIKTRKSNIELPDQLNSTCTNDDASLLIDCYAAEIRALQHQANPSKANQISKRLKEAMAVIRYRTEVEHVRDTDAARADALKGFREVQNMLAHFSEKTNVLKLLQSYAAAYKAYVSSCSPQIRDRIEFAMGDYRRSQYSDYRSSTINEGTLDEMESNIRNQVARVSLIHFQSSTDLYISGYLNPNDLVKRNVELENYATNYFAGGFRVGIHQRLKDENLPWFIRGTGPMVEAGYNYIGGDDTSLGSHRHEVDLRFGWRQYFANHVFITPKFGFGQAYNWLNFGRGFPLEKEVSTMIGFEGLGGLEFCVNANTCLAVEGGYFYEETMSGEPEYNNQGPVIMTTVIPNRMKERRK